LLTGEEREMKIQEHDDILQKQVLPDIDVLKKVTAAHEQNIQEITENLKQFNQRVDGLKNNQDKTTNAVDSLNINLQQIGTDLKRQNEKLFDHVLGRDTLKVQQEGAMSIAKLDLKGKIIVAVLGSSSLLLAGYTIYEKLIAG
jgi:chromosome segregation ATPase